MESSLILAHLKAILGFAMAIYMMEAVRSNSPLMVLLGAGAIIWIIYRLFTWDVVVQSEKDDQDEKDTLIQ